MTLRRFEIDYEGEGEITKLIMGGHSRVFEKGVELARVLPGSSDFKDKSKFSATVGFGRRVPEGTGPTAVARGTILISLLADLGKFVRKEALPKLTPFL